MLYTHHHIPENDGPKRFDRAEVTSGTATYHHGADPQQHGISDSAYDLSFRGPGGADLLIELTPDQAVSITEELLAYTHRHPSAELVDLAHNLLLEAGWHESIDGALNPPEPGPYGFTVVVKAKTAEEAEKAILRRLRAGGDRDRFRVEVAGELVWDGEGTL